MRIQTTWAQRVKWSDVVGVGEEIVPRGSGVGGCCGGYVKTTKCVCVVGARCASVF